MQLVARDTLTYVAFMSVYVLTACLSQPFLSIVDWLWVPAATSGAQDAFLMGASLRRQLTDHEYATCDAYVALDDVETLDDWYAWLECSFARTVFGGSAATYDGVEERACAAHHCPRPGLSLLGPHAVFGAVRVAQVRSKERACDVANSVLKASGPNATSKSNGFKCFGDRRGRFTVDSEDRSDFSTFSLTGEPFPFEGLYAMVQQKQQQADDDVGRRLEEEEEEEEVDAATTRLDRDHRPAAERAMAATSMLSPLGNWYPAPAFSVVLSPHEMTASDAQTAIDALRESFYFDLATRAAFVDLVVFNPMLNYFSKIRVVAEMSRTGGVRCSYVADTMPLFRDRYGDLETAYDRFVWALRFPVMLAFYSYYLLQGVEEMRNVGVRLYFSSFLNACLILNIAFFVAAWSLRLYISAALLTSQSNFDAFARNYLHEFHPAVKLLRQANSLEAFNAFLNWFKLVSYLSIAPSFGKLTRTLARALQPVLSFATVFVFVFFGFAQAHCMVLYDRSEAFATITKSSFTLLRSLLGDFDFETLHSNERIYGPILFISFISISSLVILNMIIAIISDAYCEVDQEMKDEKKALEADGRHADENLHDLLLAIRLYLSGFLPRRTSVPKNGPSRVSPAERRKAPTLATVSTFASLFAPGRETLCTLRPSAEEDRKDGPEEADPRETPPLADAFVALARLGARLDPDAVATLSGLAADDVAAVAAELAETLRAFERRTMQPPGAAG